MGQSVIEVNGTRYDASTGKVITDMPVIQPSRPQKSGHNIDGIVSTQSNAHALAPAAKKHVSTALRARQVHDVSMVRTPKTLRSKTLMRSVVKKPFSTSPALAKPKHTTITPSASYSGSQINRLAAAHKTPQHQQVSHFSQQSHSQTKLQPKIVSSLPVASQKPQPTQQSTHTTSSLTATAHTESTHFVDSQLAKTAQTLQATEKKKPLHKRFGSKLKRHRFKSIASVSLAVALIGGFIVYQNLPTISLVMANREAGISAKLPKGIPSSFAINKVTGNEGGSVVLAYDSRVDERNFTLTQVKADTTVRSLEESVARTSGNQYQTYQAGGITLFMSPGDRVDWIDGEMRYNITGSTGFSPDQIAQIATSL